MKPGFQDKNLSDWDILTLLCKWMSSRCRVRFTGQYVNNVCEIHRPVCEQCCLYSCYVQHTCMCSHTSAVTLATEWLKSMSFTCTWSLPPCLRSQKHCLPPHTPLFCLCAGPAPVLLLQWQNQVPLPWCRMSLHQACRRAHKISLQVKLLHLFHILRSRVSHASPVFSYECYTLHEERFVKLRRLVSCLVEKHVFTPPFPWYLSRDYRRLSVDTGQTKLGETQWQTDLHLGKWLSSMVRPMSMVLAPSLTMTQSLGRSSEMWWNDV